MPVQEGTSTPAPSGLFQLAIAGWLFLVVFVLAKSLLSPTNHSNYPYYEYGATRWWSEQNMYDMGEEQIDYRYGPVFAVAISPLVVLPRWLGGLLWTWLNLGVFFWSLLVLTERVLPGTWSSRREGAFLLLVLLGSMQTIWSAQVNPLVFALVALACVAVSEERWTWAAVLVAVSGHIKVWPLAAALLLIACYPRQFTWRFALALAAIGAIPFLTKPFSIVVWQYSEWFHAMFGRAQVRHEYRDVWRVLEILGVSPKRGWYAIPQLTCAGLALAGCLWQKRRGAPIGHLLTFILGMWTAWQMAFGPATERNTRSGSSPR
jgi:Glycosyltransferase family 87